MAKHATTRTRALFDGGQDLPIFAGKTAKAEEAERIFRTKAEIKRLGESLGSARTEFEARERVTKARLAEMEPLTRAYKLVFATKADKEKEAKRLTRVRVEFRALKEAYEKAKRDFDGRAKATEKRIAELKTSLTNGAHKIGPALGVFGIEIDPRHR